MHQTGRIEKRPAGMGLLALQGLILFLATAFFALMPPENGPILLVPLHGHDVVGMMGDDARLLGKGRFPGSLVITGQHPSFVTALLHQGVLVLPAVPVLCGAATTVES
jgi:hypothetical protein